MSDDDDEMTLGARERVAADDEVSEAVDRGRVAADDEVSVGADDDSVSLRFPEERARTGSATGSDGKIFRPFSSLLNSVKTL